MHTRFAKVKELGFVVWHGRHMVYHVLLGLVWGWYVGAQWIFVSVLGSLLPDLDHFLYFFTYGKGDSYTKTAATFFKNRQWRQLTTFLAREHKHNTSLTFHNYYTVAVCVGITLFASIFGFRISVVFFGAMTSHFLFDIAEDIVLLGRVNPNWKRWGRPKR